MLYRLVRPMQRSGSRIPQFVKRIPADIRDRLLGRTLAIPLGDETLYLKVSPKADSIRFSLRTDSPSTAKVRQAEVLAYLEQAFAAVRNNRPVALTRKQTVALSRDVYEDWAAEHLATEVIHAEMVDGKPEVQVSCSPLSPEFEAEALRAAIRNLEAWRDGQSDTPGDRAKFERTVSPIIERLLAKHGIAEVDDASHILLGQAVVAALLDGMNTHLRHVQGDYSPDPNADRFGAPFSRHEAGAAQSQAPLSLTGLVDSWWTEAKATGRKESTRESYANTFAAFAAFLKHDDARRVIADDVVRFKDHRLNTINRRTGKPVSAKTVKDSDLVALKSVFAWAVANRKLPSNPATGITLKLGKPAKLREKGFTDAEAKCLLAHALHAPPSRDAPKTAAAKRWVPWLLAYTGARVGEIAQLRKQDLRREGDDWVVKITPEAGTVKTNQARDVVLHPHLVEMGFPNFADKSPAGHLFIKPDKKGEMRGAIRTIENRLREEARSVVPDSRVSPTHGWRHRFKTVGMEAGIDHRILDAIQGHAPKTQGEAYGDVTLKVMAAAIRKLPRYSV